MKKLLFLLLATSLWSCKKQDNFKDDLSNFSIDASRSFSQGDGLYDVLGYGMDMTLDPLNPNSVKMEPIVDVGRFASDYASQLPSYLNQSNTTVGKSDFSSGLTSVDYLNTLTKTRGINAGVGEVKIAGSDKSNGSGTSSQNSLFKATLNASTTINTSNGSLSKFSFARAEVSHRVKRLAFTGNTTVDMLMNYLTPAFVNNVNSLSADELVRRHGTHVLLDISLGGVMSFDYSAVISNKSYTSDRKSDIKASLGATVQNITGINIGYDASTTQVNNIKSASQSVSCKLNYFGGANSGQSITIDATQNTSQTINLGNWTSSINSTNAAVIDIDKAVYLYDLISDPGKKAAVKAAVENYINAAQVTINTDPIYQFYSNNQGGNHYTSGDINATNGFAGWQRQGIDFRAFLGQAPGTVPVYLFYNAGSFDHYSTTDINATTGHPGWEFYGATYYAFPTQVAGTIPIYLYWNANGSDHFVTSNPNIASAYPGWQKYGIAFYAYPN